MSKPKLRDVIKKMGKKPKLQVATKPPQEVRKISSEEKEQFRLFQMRIDVLNIRLRDALKKSDMKKYREIIDERENAQKEFWYDERIRRLF